MVQEKGRLRLLTQRLSRDFAGRVKYSTLCPSRSCSPSDARRAMPTSGDLAGRGNSEGLLMVVRLLFALYYGAIGGWSRGKAECFYRPVSAAMRWRRSTPD